MKDFMRRVVHGLALGLGITIALAIGLAITTHLDHSDLPKVAKGDPSKVSVTYVRDVTTPAGRTVVGTLTNAGTETAPGMQLTVEFFDRDGHLIDTCSDFTYSDIGAKASVPFKVECRDPDAPKLAPHASFKVRAGFSVGVFVK
jgi:hypothetical protein